jgi:hypothetical protein
MSWLRRPAAIYQPQQQSLAGALRSELAATLRARSSRRLLLAALGLSAGLAMAANGLVLDQAAGYASEHSGMGYSTSEFLGQFDPTSDSLKWLVVALLPMMAFGALVCLRGRRYEVMTGPPARRTLLAAKVISVAVLALLAGEILSLASFFLGELAFGLLVTGSLTRGADLRAVTGGGLFLGVGAMLGFGLAAVLRGISPAASQAAVLTLTFLAWTAAWVAEALPAGVGQWFPFRVGARISSTAPGHGFSPWTVLAVFCAYTAAIIVIGLAAGTRPPRRLPATWLSNRRHAVGK